MAMTIQVNIVSAESKIFSGAAELVVAMAEEGEVGIEPGHAQMLATLKPGSVRVVKADGGDEYFYVRGGILEVQPHAVTILADVAARAADIDELEALEAKKRAEEALKERTTEFDYAQARAALTEALAQLQTIRKLHDKAR